MKRRRPSQGPRPLARIEADRSAPLVLSIDASGPVECVGLAQGPLVLAESSRRRARGRGSALAARVHDVLRDADRTVDELSGIACVVGPGSFTGIRVGIATAQGLSAALGIPTLAWTATAAWALAVQGPVVVALDARRDEVYGEAFNVAASGDLDGLLPLRLCAPDAWFEATASLPDPLVVGDGARLYADRMTAAWGRTARILRHLSGPALGSVAARSAATLAAEPDRASERLNPIYLRDHDAAKPRSG
jgi:tRNA threonylcarbamoyladenosine biosynthesis protein TsaB